MNDDNGIREEMFRYLRRELKPEEQRRFEEDLSRDAELRAELEDIRSLSAGLEIIDQLESGHISSGILATFAAAPDSVDDDTKSKIRAHLEECVECNEELDLCRESQKAAKEIRVKSTDSVWDRLLNIIAVRAAVSAGASVIAFRPAFAAAAALLLVVIGYFAGGGLVPSSGISAFELVPGSVRGVEPENILTLAHDDMLVRLEFMLPVLEGNTYDFELYDSSHRLIQTKPGNQADKVFAWEVPAAYLQAGNYEVVVSERGSDGIAEEQYRIPFRVDIRY